MILVLLTSLLFAEEKQTRYQKTTQIDFEAIDITGEMIKPQGSLIVERGNTRFNPLIKLRTDWNQEMNQSVILVK
jgi:hypothetical protein